MSVCNYFNFLPANQFLLVTMGTCRCIFFHCQLKHISGGKKRTGTDFWKVILLLIFYNPFIMVMSSFTFSAPLCKCHYSMLSDDNNKRKKNEQNKKERFKEWESIQHFWPGAQRDSHLGSTSRPAHLSKISKQKRLKAGLSVKWIRVRFVSRLCVWL